MKKLFLVSLLAVFALSFTGGGEAWAAPTALGASGLSATGDFLSPQDYDYTDNGAIRNLSIKTPMEITGNGVGNLPLNIDFQTDVTLNNVIGVNMITASQGTPTIELKGSNSIVVMAIGAGTGLNVKVADGIVTNASDLNIMTGVTLTIASGATLNNASIIANNGTINNIGRINDIGSITNFGAGTINNSGKIYSYNNIAGVTDTGGTVEIIPMLRFTDSPDYDIPASAVGMAIAPIDVKPCVTGGKTPYTFAADSLPPGITIDPTTGIISGAPTATGPAGTATITVTDDMSATAEITINYGAVGPADDFIPVTGITGVPTTTVVGTPLTLTGTVEPSDATNNTIVWSVKEAGTTGAAITDGKLTTAAIGTVTVTATIENGKAVGVPYTEDFDIIAVANFVPVTDITDVPTDAVVGTPLTLTGTVTPSDATYDTIVWSVKEAGTTGATITDGKLTATAAGTVTVTATITNGTDFGVDYTREFDITVTKRRQSSGGCGNVGFGAMTLLLAAATLILKKRG
ncbi:hypothetical protein FACS1894187_04850 [Synergistales bacterium]|nr:hypothetical protein FACS1894187_04850 [Synergistales bacterium]